MTDWATGKGTSSWPCHLHLLLCREIWSREHPAPADSQDKVRLALTFLKNQKDRALQHCALKPCARHTTTSALERLILACIWIGNPETQRRVMFLWKSRVQETRKRNESLPAGHCLQNYQKARRKKLQHNNRLESWKSARGPLTKTMQQHSNIIWLGL